MRRWIGGLLAALLVAVPLSAQDKDKGTDEKGNDRIKQFKEVQDDYKQAVPEAVKALRAAKTPQERKAVFAKLNKDFVPRIIKIVEADPKNKQSFDMLTWAIQALPDPDSKVYDALAEHWAKDAKIKPVCQLLSMNPQENGTTLLRKVLEENSDKDAKGLACFALAKVYADKAEKNKGDKKAADEAEKIYERAGKDFADVKLGNTTLGEMAKGSLFEMRHLQIGMTAPNIGSEDLEGKKVELKDYKGKVVVLDIWATWCGPCRAMIPHEREMVEKLKGKPFALISISADEKKDTLREFLEKEKMPWTHWWNGQTGGILTAWNVQHFPTIYVIDAKGVIRFKEIRGAELEEAVEKLLAEVKK
jgi:thiol-disulfide isomerase/thioredoxin